MNICLEAKKKTIIKKKVPLIWIHEVLVKIYSVLVECVAPIFQNPVSDMDMKMDSNHLKKS